MMRRIRAALTRAFLNVEIPESIEDRRRRERLQLQLEGLTPHDELRRLALVVVCEWTDDEASDADFQAAMEQLATFLTRTWTA